MQKRLENDAVKKNRDYVIIPVCRCDLWWVGMVIVVMGQSPDCKGNNQKCDCKRVKAHNAVKRVIWPSCTHTPAVIFESN